MTLQETHRLRKLDEAFIANAWSRFRKTVKLTTAKGTVEVTIRRHGIGKYLASTFGMSLAGDTPSAAALRVITALSN